MNHKNIGRFYVSNVFFHDLRPGDGTNLFNGMVIFETNRNFASMRTEYMAMHVDFDDVREGEMVPFYKPVFDKIGPFPVWVRQDNQRG